MAQRAESAHTEGGPESVCVSHVRTAERTYEVLSPRDTHDVIQLLITFI